MSPKCLLEVIPRSSHNLLLIKDQLMSTLDDHISIQSVRVVLSGMVRLLLANEISICKSSPKKSFPPGNRDAALLRV